MEGCGTAILWVPEHPVLALVVRKDGQCCCGAEGNLILTTALSVAILVDLSTSVLILICEDQLLERKLRNTNEAINIIPNRNTGDQEILAGVYGSEDMRIGSISCVMDDQDHCCMSIVGNQTTAQVQLGTASCFLHDLVATEQRSLLLVLSKDNSRSLFLNSTV